METPDWYTDEMAIESTLAHERHWRKAGELLAGEDAQVIREVLDRRRLDRVCHMAPGSALPTIAADGGFFSSYASSYLKGDHVLTSSYQSRDRMGWSQAYVFYGFWPQWWLCRKHDDLVMFVVNAESVCLQSNALFAPDQHSARTMMNQHTLSRAARARILDDCFDGAEPRKTAEIAAGRVLLASIEGVVFPDEQACDYWWPRFRAAWPTYEAAEHIEPFVRATGRFRFPSDYVSRHYRG